MYNSPTLKLANNANTSFRGLSKQVSKQVDKQVCKQAIKQEQFLKSRRYVIFDSLIDKTKLY